MWGIRKIFLYPTLLAIVRSKKFIALATITFGVIVSILLRGQLAHLCFNLSIEIGEKYNCTISKQSSFVALIQDTKLIVQNEVSIAKKKLGENFDFL